MQALYLHGLDPIAETLADGHSYGFRRERCCADAIEQLHLLLGNLYGPRWIVEGDIKSCYDRIGHERLLQHIQMDKWILRARLKSGFMEGRQLFPTEEGTPQGGIISPVLANRTLDGLQQLLESHFMSNPQQRKRNKVHLVRYADDFVITGTSRFLLEHRVKPLVAQFLKERGLELSHEKTNITHLDNGFDFLGQRIRRYPCRKVLVKPAKKRVKIFLRKIKETIRESGSWTAGQLVYRLNQQIKGWAMYHRHAASKHTFNRVDRRIWRMVWCWCRRRHQNKSLTWIAKTYFKQRGYRHWIFTGTLPGKKGKELPIELMEAGDVHIRRFVKIRSAANPYDPEWELYLEERKYWRMEGTLDGKGRIKSVWENQGGRCVQCGQMLQNSE